MDSVIFVFKYATITCMNYHILISFFVIDDSIFITKCLLGNFTPIPSPSHVLLLIQCITKVVDGFARIGTDIHVDINMDIGTQ